MNKDDLKKYDDIDDPELNEALFSLVQELKIANNDVEERLRQQQKRTEEARVHAAEELKRMFDVAVYGTALLGTAVAALTVVNSM